MFFLQLLDAFRWIIKQGAKGIATEKSYSYRGYDEKCKTSGVVTGATIANWKMLPEDENQIKAYLFTNGPLSVALNAEQLQFYSGGVFNPMRCDPKNLDHGVLMVGFGGMDGSQPYWVVKNSCMYIGACNNYSKGVLIGVKMVISAVRFI